MLKSRSKIGRFFGYENSPPNGLELKRIFRSERTRVLNQIEPVRRVICVDGLELWAGTYFHDVVRVVVSTLRVGHRCSAVVEHDGTEGDETWALQVAEHGLHVRVNSDRLTLASPED